MPPYLKICFLVNPIAGIGGRPGLKGSDNVVEEAIKKGGTPLSPIKAKTFLSKLSRDILDKVLFLTADNKMGEDYLSEIGANYEIVHKSSKPSTAEDTISVVKKAILSHGKLIVFVGGDGTARDVLSAIKDLKVDIPILGVPAGVKVYSSVFGNTPRDSANILKAFVRGVASISLREIVDIDEESVRSDRMSIKIYGYALTPTYSNLLQPSKATFHGVYDEENKEAIANYIVENMDPKALYVLGPGSTVKKIGDRLGINKTLLGVDLYAEGKLLRKDVGEDEIIKAMKRYPKTFMVISPIGKQGFILGRGNQQIGPEVLRKITKKELIVVATRGKLTETPVLRVDTGYPDLDKKFRGYLRVIVDYNMEKIVKVV